MKIAVLGASGFVGSALCERLYFEGNIDFTAFVHSTGNAARIARLGGTVQTLDLLQREQLFDLLQGHDIVVDCIMGDQATMTRGFENLMFALKKLRPKKFVHLSSISIYGTNPAPESMTEAGKPDPQGNGYAVLKLQQDEAVFRLQAQGVPSYILCPVNIVGPYSTFTSGLIESLLAGPMPLVDGGTTPSNLIHVDNLVEAIMAAVRSSSGDGDRYFVNETRPVSWRQIFEDHARAIGIDLEVFHVKREQVIPLLAVGKRGASLADHAKTIMSGEFRKTVSKVPPLGWVNDLAGTVFQSLPDQTQQRLKERVKWPITIPKSKSGPDLADRNVRFQVRQHFHSTDKLATRLGWTPPLSYEQGMETIADWIRFAGFTSSTADLVGRPEYVVS